MYLFTYSDLIAKLGNDCDITDEAFISSTELLGYLNEAINDAQAAIHNLNFEDKYFLTSATFSWVSGTADYDLPTDIYANKIRQIFYSNGSMKYEIQRIKNLLETNYFVANDYYAYIIRNATAGTAPKARFYPTPAETSTNAIIWYIREMKKMTTSTIDTTNVCEVPECQNFVFAHVKNSVANKTRRADLIATAKEDKILQYNLMLENLQQMVLDENNMIPMDTSHYLMGSDDWRR